MFEALLWATAGVVLAAALLAWHSSRDIFHPALITGPMFLFLYVWMPMKIHRSGELAFYFDRDQLIFVQSVNLLGVTAFLLGCLSSRARLSRSLFETETYAPRFLRLLAGGIITGGLGLSAWLILIIKSGGIYNAFSKAYSGGWDDSGYVRDGSILLLAGVLLLHAAIALRPRRIGPVLALIAFTVPWLIQAILTSRRGPTFALITVLSIGYYLYRGRRPNPLVAGAAGIAVGYLVLFLVANRQQIYLGSEFELSSDVTTVVETPNTGNEYIYGAGSLLSADRRGTFFWGRRYLAQVLVRPIPTAVWPTKYEDFGVPELLHNAGTGEGIADTLGWEGAPGSAPGIVADMWVEASAGGLVLMGFFGWLCGYVWKKAITQRGPWAAQYAVCCALSIYFVMQTMEAVIFRSLLLSIPIWLVWHWSLRETRQRGLAYARNIDTTTTATRGPEPLVAAGRVFPAQPPNGATL